MSIRFRSLMLALLFGVFATPAWALAPVQEPVPAEEPPPEGEEDVEEVVEGEVVDQGAVQGEEVIEGPVEDPNSPYLAVVGGDVYTVTRGVILDGTVLCKDGRILKVGQSVSIPDGARTVNAEGMRIYPGLVAVDSRGIIPGRGTDSVDSFDPFALYVDLALAGGLTTVQSRGTIGKLTRGTLNGHLLGTTSWVEISYSSSSPSGRRSTRARLETAREYLRYLRAFELDKELEKKDLVEPESKGIPMDFVGLLKGERMARFRGNTASDLIAICELLEEFPMRSVIVGGREAWTMAPRIGRAGASMVLTPRAKDWADSELNRPSGWSIENARILWDSGVEFAILPGQSGISLGGLAGRDLLTLPMEVAFAIRGGLSQDAALRSITLDAARILGVADRIGSIEVGKDADLIIADGDLFDYRTFVQWAVVNGRVAYDKQKASYFAHIRPRDEEGPSPVEVLLEDITDGEDVVEGPVEIDAPEVDPPSGGSGGR
ncbi:MAG: amidohydrolase family protein [Planctomycetes bacterium]|nr:amidohydrolase family protein [Planctomycetota bacterium]